MNDQKHNLIQAARNGVQAAFGELVRQYQKRVFALAVRMCPTPELAEEAERSILAFTPGASTERLQDMHMQNIRRPMYPLDDNFME